MKKINLRLWIVLILAIFLYFWQIQTNQYFSYDQARDFLIVKKILVDHKLTLIGPSLGIADGAYLPPWYYYLITPALFISKFHLWGPDVLSSIFGILGVTVFYLLAKKMFNEKVAFLSSLFYVFNPFMLQAARHIRNPHLLPLFLLLFVYNAKSFLESKKSINLFCSSFFLGVAISFHITSIVFLPILIYLFIVQLKRKKYLSLIFSALTPLGLFAPLLFFDLKHNFGISKAVLGFFSQKTEFGLFDKLLRLISFVYKIPLILFSGIFQKQLLSLRSMPLFSLEQIDFGNLVKIDLIKLLASIILFCFLLFFTFKGIKEKRRSIKNNFIFILSFVFFGFCVSFLLPKNYSYLYYFYNLFPFLFLLLGGCFFLFLEKVKKNIFYLPVLILGIMPFWPIGLKTETRLESYFIPVVKIITNDFNNNSNFAIAANLEKNRWEKNGIEYRYFLEALYKLPVLGSEQSDYTKADVLYLIDEGDLKDPISLKGMELEAFKPGKIETVWQAETGQTIYKMTK